MEKKTIEQWCNEYNTIILSYDGFRDEGPSDLLTKKEFLQGMMTCTIQFSPEISYALENLKDEVRKKGFN